jgi:CRISPR-associated protein Csc2
MYDTAYSIRDSSAIVEEKFQNAPGDQFAKGATTAIREPDFIVPGTVFPCVVTLRDATFDELVFVLGITKMNKRYGQRHQELAEWKITFWEYIAGSKRDLQI